MEFKSFQFKAAGENQIEGYAATFGNVDSVGDIILQGAFVKSLATNKPKMLWQHDKDDLIGVWNEYFEDSNGLFVKGIFANTQCGNEARELAKIGAVSEMSIGYSVVKANYRADGVRILEELELREVSLVTFPANEKAKITRVKSLPQNVREFEIFLRDVGGYSHKAAKSIAAKGFKSADCRDDTEDELINSLQKTINILKG
jgi:HK97 family phage prohead protease